MVIRLPVVVVPVLVRLASVAVPVTVRLAVVILAVTVKLAAVKPAVDVLPLMFMLPAPMFAVTVTLAAVTVPDATTLLALLRLPTLTVLVFNEDRNQALLLLQYT